MKPCAKYIALVLLIGIVACTQNIQVPAISDMEPQEKATMAMEIYLKMRASYENSVKLPNLSAAEKEVLRTKRDLLEKAGPIIKEYNDSVVSGTPLSVATAQWIDAFLTQYRY